MGALRASRAALSRRLLTARAPRPAGTNRWPGWSPRWRCARPVGRHRLPCPPIAGPLTVGLVQTLLDTPEKRDLLRYIRLFVPTAQQVARGRRAPAASAPVLTAAPSRSSASASTRWPRTIA